jgi:hypothetical protein
MWRIRRRFLHGTENAKTSQGRRLRASAELEVGGMDPVAAVIEAYDFARGSGLSRAEAFGRAIDAFRMNRPELSFGEAGREVARILLQAAAATRIAQGHDAMPQPAISW